MVIRRPHASAFVASLVVLLIAVTVTTGIAVTVRPMAAGVPLDLRISNEQALIARGLAGVPAPGQPTTPIAVDRVVTDGVSTYIQFHSTVPRSRVPNVIPTLYDDMGTPINSEGGASSDDGTVGWARFLPPWFPWHLPAGPIRGVVMLGPLPRTTRAAVLRFMNGETVRVPLNPAALRSFRVYRGPLVARAALQLQVVAASDMSLALGFSPFGDIRNATLTNAQGYGIPLRTMSSGCGGPFPDTGLACREVWTYPPQRRGVNLTLTISSFAADPKGAVANAVGTGPWHLAVVVP